MAKGRKTGGRDFKKGHKFSKGGTRLPEHVTHARMINRIDVEKMLNKYSNHNMKELKSALENPLTTAMELCVIRVYIEGIKKGDERRLGFLWDRLVGPVPKQARVEVSGQSLTDVLKELVDD